jgi:hypothetical protein
MLRNHGIVFTAREQQLHSFIESRDVQPACPLMLEGGECNLTAFPVFPKRVGVFSWT